MTVELRLGKVSLRVAADGTPAPDQACFFAGESAFTAATTAAHESLLTSMSPFEAVRHEHRITDCPSVVKEEDSLIASAAAQSASLQRYRGTHGRLLSFKNKR